MKCQMPNWTTKNYAFCRRSAQLEHLPASFAYTEDELLKGLTSYTAHADELASLTVREFGLPDTGGWPLIPPAPNIEGYD